MLGHPTIFLKCLHSALFGASQSVKQFLFSKGVDPDTVHLNDLKFFKAVVYILVSAITLKSRSEPTVVLLGELVWIQVQDQSRPILQVRLCGVENASVLRHDPGCEEKAQKSGGSKKSQREESNDLATELKRHIHSAES